MSINLFVLSHVDTTGIYCGQYNLHIILAINWDVSNWLQYILEVFICMMLQ